MSITKKETKVGRNIRAILEAHNMTWDTFAEESGIPLDTVKGWFKYKREPSYIDIEKVSNMFNIIFSNISSCSLSVRGVQRGLAISNFREANNLNNAYFINQLEIRKGVKYSSSQISVALNGDSSGTSEEVRDAIIDCWEIDVREYFEGYKEDKEKDMLKFEVIDPDEEFNLNKSVAKAIESCILIAKHTEGDSKQDMIDIVGKLRAFETRLIMESI